MSVRTVKLMRRRDIQAEPNTLFAFGDNMERWGRKGQAEECRGEPNAVGIPTKHRPKRDEGAYFTDEDFPRVKSEIDAGFIRLANHLKSGGNIVLPEDGLGTGLADLPGRAPRIHAYISKCIERLWEIDRTLRHDLIEPDIGGLGQSEGPDKGAGMDAAMDEGSGYTASGLALSG